MSVVPCEEEVLVSALETGEDCREESCRPIILLWQRRRYLLEWRHMLDQERHDIEKKMRRRRVSIYWLYYLL